MKPTRLFVVALLALYGLPLLNIAAVSPLSTMFYSNVAYPVVLGDICSYVYTALSILSVFSGAACLAYALASRTQRALIATLAGLSVPVQYGVIAAVDAAIYGAGELTPSYWIYSASSAAFELLRLGAVALVCILIAARAVRKDRPMELELLSAAGTLSRACVFGTVGIAAFMLVSNISETLTLILQIGAPVNMSETLTLITPYVMTAISSILGYFVMYAVMRLIDAGKEPVK